MNQQQQKATIAIANINKRPRTPPAIEEMEAQDQDQSAKRPRTPPSSPTTPIEKEENNRLNQFQTRETYEPNLELHAKFYEACKTGDVEVVKSMLDLQDKHFNPAFCVSADGWVGDHIEGTYMSIAAKGNHTEIVGLLLKDKRIDIGIYAADAMDFDNAPLAIACDLGNLEMVKLILEDGRADITAGGNLALANACENDCVDIAELLLERGAWIFDKRNCDSALNIACENGSLEMLDLLIEYNYESSNTLIYHAEESPDEHWARAMRIACRRGYIEIIKAIMHERPREDDVCHPKYICDAIIKACKHCKVEVVELLLNQYQKIVAVSHRALGKHNLHASSIRSRVFTAYNNLIGSAGEDTEKNLLGNLLHKQIYKSKLFAEALGVDYAHTLTQKKDSYESNQQQQEIIVFN